MRFDNLMRQVETKTKLMEQNTSKAQTAPFSKLMTPATTGEKGMMYFGWVMSVLTGIGLPLFVLFISRMFNSFGPAESPKDTLKTVTECYGVMVACGAFIGLTGFCYWFISLKFADAMARRTKENFLGSVLKQESAWFDANNYNELAACMTKESMSICKAVGEKPGLLLQAMGMSICGLAIGFTQGWSLALTFLAIVPVMTISGAIFGAAGANKFAKSLKAYGQSAGYAEQALSAVKVVVAFGMESCEVNNYSKYLALSK